MTQICPAAKLERLVLPTDGSELSEGAVREAINLAKTCSSKLIAVSVTETNPEYETIAPQLIEKAGKEAREHLESVKARALKEGVDCEIIAHHGEEPYRYIVEEAERNKADMIVMGRRGRTGLKRLMMGSEAARTIGHAPCNVLVVPRAAKLGFKNILVATDGSKHSDASVREAAGIAKHCSSNLFVVAVVPSESVSPLDIVNLEMQKGLISEEELRTAEGNIKKAKEIVLNEGVTVKGLILAGKPYEAITHVAKGKKLLAVTAGQRSQGFSWEA